MIKMRPHLLGVPIALQHWQRHSRRDRYPTKHCARTGEMAKFILLMLKRADGPLTSLAITEAQIKERGLNAGDHTVVLMRKRVGACPTTQQRLGVVRSLPIPGSYKRWELVQ
jgi:hypothetical protein